MDPHTPPVVPERTMRPDALSAAHGQHADPAPAATRHRCLLHRILGLGRGRLRFLRPRLDRSDYLGEFDGFDRSASSTSAPAGTAQLCQARDLLKTSLAALTNPSLLKGATSGIKAALSQVQNDLNALKAAANGNYQPQVDAVRTSLQQLEAGAGNMGHGQFAQNLPAVGSAKANWEPPPRHCSPRSRSPAGPRPDHNRQSARRVATTARSRGRSATAAATPNAADMTVGKARPTRGVDSSPAENGHGTAPPVSPRAGLAARIRGLVGAIRDGDDATVEAAIIQLSSRRRILAPLGMVVGAFAMLFEGLKLLVSNWRLTLVQVLPAMWIWVAMIDLKAHVFHGKSFHPLHGWALLAAIIAVAVITAAGFFLNAVFAFAIAKPGRPQIRPAFTEARSHAAIVLGAGSVVGLLLGVAALYSDRWGRGWFAISMSIVIAVMMVAYVAVPSRLIGVKTTYSKADKLKATAVGGAIGGVVCFPPVRAGPHRHPHARIPRPFHPRNLRARTRRHLAGRHYQRRQSDQDERQTGSGHSDRTREVDGCQ